MKPTDVLKDEHHGVKVSLQVLNTLCVKISAEQCGESGAYADNLNQLIEFFRIFVDKCHHAKEEEILFPALIDAGLPKEGGPVQVMLHEHELGRKLVSGMEVLLKNFEAGKCKDLKELTETANSYIQLLTDHIAKEDNILYPVADSKIPAKVQAKMIESFEKIEADRIGEGRHEQFHAMLKEFHHKYLK